QKIPPSKTVNMTLTSLLATTIPSKPPLPVPLLQTQVMPPTPSVLLVGACQTIAPANILLCFPNMASVAVPAKTPTGNLILLRCILFVVVTSAPAIITCSTLATAVTTGMAAPAVAPAGASCTSTLPASTLPTTATPVTTASRYVV